MPLLVLLNVAKVASNVPDVLRTSTKNRSKIVPGASLVVIFNQKLRLPPLGTVTVWYSVLVVLLLTPRIMYAEPLCGKLPVLRTVDPLITHGVVPVSKPGLTITLVPPPPVPACVTEKVCPAIVIVPLREPVPPLAATE